MSRLPETQAAVAAAVAAQADRLAAFARGIGRHVDVGLRSLRESQVVRLDAARPPLSRPEDIDAAVDALKGASVVVDPQERVREAAKAILEHGPVVGAFSSRGGAVDGGELDGPLLDVVRDLYRDSGREPPGNLLPPSQVGEFRRVMEDGSMDPQERRTVLLRMSGLPARSDEEAFGRYLAANESLLRKAREAVAALARSAVQGKGRILAFPEREVSAVSVPVEGGGKVVPIREGAAMFAAAREAPSPAEAARGLLRAAAGMNVRLPGEDALKGLASGEFASPKVAAGVLSAASKALLAEADSRGMRETAAEWKAMKAESLSLGERIAARSILLAKAEEAVREAEASLPEGSVSKAYGLAEALRGHWGRITAMLEERYPHVVPGSWRSELSLLEREGMSLRSLENRKAAIDRTLAAEGSSPLSAAARALSSAKRAVEALAPARSPSPQERGASASRSVRPGVDKGMGL